MSAVYRAHASSTSVAILRRTCRFAKGRARKPVPKTAARRRSIPLDVRVRDECRIDRAGRVCITLTQQILSNILTISDDEKINRYSNAAFDLQNCHNYLSILFRSIDSMNVVILPDKCKLMLSDEKC